MKYIKYLLGILFSGVIFHSCLLIDSARSIQVEIMKPAVFTIPDSVHSVGIINRIGTGYDSVRFEFIHSGHIISDSITKYSNLTGNCIESLAQYLKEKNYFTRVINFNDSLNSLIKPGLPLNSQSDLFRSSNSDMLIVLNDCKFDLTSADLESDVFVTLASLNWILSYKGDTLSYLYNQIDTLIYDADPAFNYLRNRSNALESSSNFLGQSFGTKVIPDWLKVERLYYRSNNPEMLKAEKLAMNSDWLKAAEIWNKMTKNKNKNIAAKASFNMALACEMEGKVDAAIDWLVMSYTILSGVNEEHQKNCKRYIDILALRKKEITKLAVQVR